MQASKHNIEEPGPFGEIKKQQFAKRIGRECYL